MHKELIKNWLNVEDVKEKRYRSNLLASWMIDNCGMTLYYKDLTDNEAYQFSLQVIKDG